MKFVQEVLSPAKSGGDKIRSRVPLLRQEIDDLCISVRHFEDSLVEDMCLSAVCNLLLPPAFPEDHLWGGCGRVNSFGGSSDLVPRGCQESVPRAGLLSVHFGNSAMLPFGSWVSSEMDGNLKYTNSTSVYPAFPGGYEARDQLYCVAYCLCKMECFWVLI